ncbi:pilus assembly protein TadG-related protein [Magnetospira sp. QH-2]|uniref:pilus assembly protein TadG-related protein n=1 Tax=Magnetospira sp. (strain QH-2) TaxID=1288970 RepID=UPI0003E80ECE|nr:pilus assembly protein TadG-related protein [Magnetospira sp. QH-2]CCQ73545.1 Protein of unknown function [Magnetospira sp. QH-2]
MKNILNTFLKNEHGGTAVYAAFFGLTIVATGALSLDYGRHTLLRNQMQNRADAGALAGAAQLDGRPGAQARAEAVARGATQAHSSLASDNSLLEVATVTFYSDRADPPTLAVDDSDSKYIEVIMADRTIAYMFTGILDKFSDSGSAPPKTETVDARSVAMPRPYICEAPPLMICDPKEFNAADDLALPGAVGRQLALKPPPKSGSWAPGNYGLLALPDGSIGASSLMEALAAVEPEDCYTLDVGTAPGVKTNKIQDGINARFDLPGGLPYPAPNVIAYPRDPEVADPVAGQMGSGNWDREGYWTAKHGGSLPMALDDATRYQVYLYELGETFARDGRQTIHPVDDPATLPGSYTLVAPATADIPFDAAHPDDPTYDGEPSQTVASNGPARRIAKVAVLECLAEGVKGSHTYPTNGNYVEMFITEPVPNAPAGAIMGEIIRPITPSTSPDFHANVTLVE